MVDSYVEQFNADDDELYKQVFPNDRAAEFLKANIPLFECPDKELEKTYYFRWWTFRKHIKETPRGYIITEFLPNVRWAGKYNSINCAAQHHMAEGRWLRNPEYIDDYARFWFTEDGEPLRYSLAIASAVWDVYSVRRDEALIRDLYEPLKETFAEWEKSHRDSTGLYWRKDDRDGGEMSCSGELSPDAVGYRPNLNSFMYGDAVALSKMASLLGNSADAAFYESKAREIKTLVDNMLWDPADRFYKVIPRNGEMKHAPCREELGYIPFAYDLPDEDKLVAWEQLFDPQGFKAPYGPTTCERRYPGYRISYEGHECQWNGPSWPYATAQTLTGMEKSLHRFGEKVLTKERYLEVLQTYSNSHRLDGKCWIDENINPDTGDWISRTRLMTWKNGTWWAGKGGVERGKDYNHSTFCDLVITGLLGVQPQADGSIVIEPLIPDGQWDWFCLDCVECCGKTLTILYDKDGSKYHRGKGFRIFVNGRKAYSSDSYAVKAVV